ncbi:division/cell wall cluster transcriptional repressor MraZ [bacterium SCSIO 12696]|nr:division/cell wall cluster transcriptional repressor MraZ [bacterium SCSIO 12696]
MFRGSNDINIDAKGRMAVPARFRDELMELCGGRLVVTVNNDVQDRCLLLYPMDEWIQIENKISRLPSHPKARRLQRLLIGNAREVEIDGSGRILLPPELRQHASLDKKVRLLGVGHRFEIWDGGLYSAHHEECLEESMDDQPIPEEMLSLSL